MDTEANAVDDGLGAANAGGSRPIGAILGAARAARGLELTDVARDTRVPVRHLAAIEADAHDSLPALPYAIGFVKAFARVVGVDPDMAAARFRAETSKAAHVPAAPTMAPVDERRLPPRGLVTASIAALIAGIALVAAWSAGAFDPAIPAAPTVAVAPAPVVQASAAPVVSAPPVAATTSPPDASLPPAGVAPAVVSPATPGTVVITASEDAWFKVSVYDPAVGKVVSVKTGVLAKGERYVPPPTPGLRLWTGRAGALAITVDGHAIAPLGGAVETVKNVSLDPADLRARIAPPQPVGMTSGKSGG